jgi:2'-5' RNA ligase
MSEPESAIVVRIGLPPGLERVRQQFDRSAGLGVPAHVTILYPWLSAGSLTTGIREALRHISEETRSFDVRFVAARRWPGIVYLEPEPAAPFSALIDRVAAHFPDYPPYAGTIAEVVPHLTLVDNDGAPLAEVAAAADGLLPFQRTVRSIEVLAEGTDGRWRLCWRLALADEAGPRLRR